MRAGQHLHPQRRLQERYQHLPQRRHPPRSPGLSSASLIRQGSPFPIALSSSRRPPPAPHRRGRRLCLLLCEPSFPPFLCVGSRPHPRPSIRSTSATSASASVVTSASARSSP